MLVGVAGDMLLLAGCLFRGPVSFSVVREKWTCRIYRIKCRPMGCSIVSSVSQIWTLSPLTGRHCEISLPRYFFRCKGEHARHVDYRSAKLFSALRRVSLRLICNRISGILDVTTKSNWNSYLRASTRATLQWHQAVRRGSKRE